MRNIMCLNGNSLLQDLHCELSQVSPRRNGSNHDVETVTEASHSPGASPYVTPPAPEPRSFPILFSSPLSKILMEIHRFNLIIGSSERRRIQSQYLLSNSQSAIGQ
jgi:hypothetical protein